MLKKISILIICSVLVLFSLSYVSALIVTIPNKNIDVTYNEPKDIVVTLTNNADYNLSDIELENEYATMLPINLIEAGSENVTITLTIDKEGEFDTILNFIAYRQRDCGIQFTHTINIISQQEFSDYDLSICVNDKIDINNNVDENIYYRMIPKTSDCILPSGCPHLLPNSVNHNFYAFGTQGVYYFETISHQRLIIEVSNQPSMFTHNSSGIDDGSLILNINSILLPTTLEVVYIDNDFNMSYDDSQQGSITIKNTGINDAINIKLSSDSDWLVFSPDNVDIIKPGKTWATNFDIYAIGILTSSDTNKTYNKTITISSQNSGDINQIISIFVGHSDNIAGYGDLAYLRYLKDIFCPAYPHSFLCEQEPRTIIKEVPKYNCPKFLAELTAEEILELIKKTMTSANDAQRVYNLIKLYAESQNVSIGEMFDVLNQSEQNTADTKRETEDTRALVFILGFSVLIITLVVGIGYYLYKYYKKKSKKGY